MAVNKSKRLWKSPKKTSFAATAVKPSFLTFEERMKQKEELQELKNQIIEIEHQKKLEQAERRKKTLEKQERKKANQLKTAILQQGVQLISDERKVKKHFKKLKRKIVHLAPEMIEHYYKKK